MGSKSRNKKRICSLNSISIVRVEKSALLLCMEISHSDISGITTKAPCEAALMGERHVRIEISDFVMRTFVPRKKALNADAQSSNLNKNHEVTTAKSCFFGFCLLPSRLYCRYRNLTGSAAKSSSRTIPSVGNMRHPQHPAPKNSFFIFHRYYIHIVRKCQHHLDFFPSIC